jgi:hypothetical protein
MLENTEEEIKNGHSSETVKQDKEYHNTKFLTLIETMLKFHINQFAVVKIHRGVIIIMHQ